MGLTESQKQRIRVSELDDRSTESTQSEEQKEKRLKKNLITPQGLQNNIKESNIHVIGVTK